MTDHEADDELRQIALERQILEDAFTQPIETQLTEEETEEIEE